MVELKTLNRIEIIEDAKLDVESKSNDELQSTQLFYYKILTEEAIRTSSFRYVYAKIALAYISEMLNDTETIGNFNLFHGKKVKWEIANPVKKNESSESLKSNPVTRAEKYGKIVADKSAIQIKL